MRHITFKTEDILFLQLQWEKSAYVKSVSVLETEHKMPCKSQINLPQYFLICPFFKQESEVILLDQ